MSMQVFRDNIRMACSLVTKEPIKRATFEVDCVQIRGVIGSYYRFEEVR